MISAAGIAFSLFCGMEYVLSQVRWNGTPWTGMLAKLLIPALLSLGVFIVITSAAFSRRVQRLRDGEPLDDE
jgi:hypothetical protein